MIEKTPYALEFLWNQIELAYTEVRKKKYKELLEKLIFNEDIRKRVEKAKDKKGRNYEGGLLEATASQVSLMMCMYDNYPELDIDLLLTAAILKGICKTYTKKECYKIVENYPEVVPFLFKKSRKKPTPELTVFDGIEKLDNKVFLRLYKRRVADGS